MAGVEFPWSPINLAHLSMGSESKSATGEGGAIVLDAPTRRALQKVSRLSGKSQVSLVRAAVREYLEDYYDMIEVQQRLKAGKNAVPLQKVLAGLGLAD